jgi:RES domain-containing protein
MEVFRLSVLPYAKDLSGRGAELYGGRWNSAGIALLYTAANRSPAMAEVLVHLQMASMPADYHMVSIDVPDDLAILQLLASEMPANWNAFPHLQATRRFGDEFVQAQKAVGLRVPSAVTRGDFNYLLNPKHPDFRRIKVINIEKFPFDYRIFK